MSTEQSKSPPSSTVARVAIAGIVFAAWGCASAAIAASDVAPPGRAIGYVVTTIAPAVYETTDAKVECPNGLNKLGPREQFKILFPEDGSKKWKVIDSQLVRESEVWFPSMVPDQFPFIEAIGKTAIGLDLDGKVKPTDFTSPEGKPGVDNQLYRVIGCLLNYRSGASIRNSEKDFFQNYAFNRIFIELTDVDSIVNDDDVTITSYRGLDPIMRDAANGFQPGGTERVDARWGKEYIHHAKGKIVDGVLTTGPMDYIIPQQIAYESAASSVTRDARFELKLTPERAEGVIGGYADIDSFYRRTNRGWATHHLSYGQQVSPLVYRALRRNADAYPDPKTGENTAISAAYSVKMVQVRVLHPEKEVADVTGVQAVEQLAEGK